MKKIVVVMLVVMLGAINASAQIIWKADPVSVTLQNGYVYNRSDIPAGPWLQPGDNIAQKNQNYFLSLQREDYERYVREYNAFMMNPPQPVRIISTAGMGGGGLMMGGAGMVGMGMVGGTGAAAGGMVVGNGGMAGANSQVVIDNQNMMSTVGSGLQVYYDTGSNSLSVSGDPLMAAGRLFNFIGGSKKRQQTTNNAGNGNVRVVYIDAATGQPVAAPRSNTRSTATTPTTRTTTTTTRSTNTNYSGYNFASGF